MIYLDNAATTKIDKRVLDVMINSLKFNYGNPSSTYTDGRNAKEVIEKSRSDISKFFKCYSDEIYFTSGGSEGNNLLIKGIAHSYQKQGKHIITTKIEHPSVLNACKELQREGFKVTYLPVKKSGMVDISQLEKEITPDTILISIMFANNEIGTIEPIQKIGALARKNHIIFHTDAVQAVGNGNIDLSKLPIDAMTVSGHKLYAPKGTGCVFLKRGIGCRALISGGGQEKKLRSGTENTAGIEALGMAFNLLSKEMEYNVYHISSLRDYLLSKILKQYEIHKDFIINGSLEKRLPGNLSFSFSKINGDNLKLYLDSQNIEVSTGSACSSMDSKPSHVLSALKIPDKYINGTIRISIGKNNTISDMDKFIQALNSYMNDIKK